MCGHIETDKPEIKLSQLIERELGITIDAPALRILIRAHWDEISGLAHAIHGTKAAKAERWETSARPKHAS